MELTVCVCQSWLAILNRVRVLVLFNRKVSTMQLLCWYSKHQISKSYIAIFETSTLEFGSLLNRSRPFISEIKSTYLMKLIRFGNCWPETIILLSRLIIFIYSSKGIISVFFSPCNLIVRLAIKCSLCWLIWKFSLLSINCTHQKTRFRLFVL